MMIHHFRAMNLLVFKSEGEGPWSLRASRMQLKKSSNKWDVATAAHGFGA